MKKLLIIVVGIGLFTSESECGIARVLSKIGAALGSVNQIYKVYKKS